MLMWAVLANALDEIGKSKILKQRVICISLLKYIGENKSIYP